MKTGVIPFNGRTLVYKLHHGLRIHSAHYTGEAVQGAPSKAMREAIEADIQHQIDKYGVFRGIQSVGDEYGQ